MSMQVKTIQQKLTEISVDPCEVVLGDFDIIGEYTAKRMRKNDDPKYKKHGAFFRANYERGILIYNLIRQFHLKSMLEIGFGRGYATMCAAKAFYDDGTKFKIVTIDPVKDDNHMNVLRQIFPDEWFSGLSFVRGLSSDVLVDFDCDMIGLENGFDIVYIDGDHSYEATKIDWLLTRNMFSKFMLFDDYHMSTKVDAGIQCNRLIDEIDESQENCLEKELIILDRRMFHDDREYDDASIDYGQVLLTKRGVER